MASSKDTVKDIAAEERRKCPGCSTRMSSLLHDMHSKCNICRGAECDVDNKCSECAGWTEEDFSKYIKH